MSSGDLNKWCPQFEGLIESETSVNGRMRRQNPAGGKRRRSQSMRVFFCAQHVHISIQA